MLRVVLPLTKCFSDLCNIFLLEVVTWHVRYTIVLLSQVLVCEKSIWGYRKETVNLMIVIMLNKTEIMGGQKGCVSTFVKKS